MTDKLKPIEFKIHDPSPKYPWSDYANYDHMPEEIKNAYDNHLAETAKRYEKEFRVANPLYFIGEQLGRIADAMLQARLK